MKKLILLLGLVLTFGIANAKTGDQPTNEQRAHTQAMTMQKRLSLNDDQLVKVEAILLSSINSITTIQNDNNKSADQQKAEIEAVRKDRDLQFESVLTPEQMVKYKEIKQQRANRAAESGQ